MRIQSACLVVKSKTVAKDQQRNNFQTSMLIFTKFPEVKELLKEADYLVSQWVAVLVSFPGEMCLWLNTEHAPSAHQHAQ